MRNCLYNKLDLFSSFSKLFKDRRVWFQKKEGLTVLIMSWCKGVFLCLFSAIYYLSVRSLGATLSTVLILIESNGHSGLVL